MSESRDVLVERDGSGIVLVTLNRPATKNAVTQDGWIDLRQAFDEIAVTASDRVVILTGADGNFCSGADLGGPVSLSPRAGMHSVNSTCQAIRDIPKPVIAAVSGVAVGAGCNMALTCDLAIADESSTFSEIFSKRGLSVDFGGTWQLTHNLGLQRAKELAFFGRAYSARDMFDLGLLNRVVPDGQSASVAREWAEELLTLAPTSLGLTKELLNASASSTFQEALSREGVAQVFNTTTSDTREAISAFLEKRPPVFTGE
jgi:2-(1,2-epoxy-1,2-dihydrophenyl)acetyl-CoA isomerase